MKTLELEVVTVRGSYSVSKTNLVKLEFIADEEQTLTCQQAVLLRNNNVQLEAREAVTSEFNSLGIFVLSDIMFKGNGDTSMVFKADIENVESDAVIEIQHRDPGSVFIIKLIGEIESLDEDGNPIDESAADEWDDYEEDEEDDTPPLYGDDDTSWEDDDENNQEEW